MSKHKLRLESSPLMFGILSDRKPQGITVGDWHIFEIYKPNAHEDVDNGLGSYRIVIETAVAEPQEIQKRRLEGIRLSEDLERVWIYVWGTPLHGSGFGVNLVEYEAPKGWNTNYDDVRQTLDRKHFGLTYDSIRFEPRHWRYSDSFPLEHALRIRAKYLAADRVTRALVDFHFQGHVSPTLDGTLFLFSKALEVVRELLPGRNNAAKEKALPKEVQSELSRPFHSLFEISNNRLNTRHAIREKRPVLKLHPPLQGEELMNFLQDTDVVVRAVVCRQFDEETVVIKKGHPLKKPHQGAGEGHGFRCAPPRPSAQSLCAAIRRVSCPDSGLTACSV